VNEAPGCDVDRMLAEPHRLTAAAEETREERLAVTAAEVRCWSDKWRGEMIIYVVGKLAWLASHAQATTRDAGAQTVGLRDVIDDGGIVLAPPAPEQLAGWQ
jgi:hypothetical protein